MDRTKAALWAAICGGAVFLGVLLPWYSVSHDGAEGVRSILRGETARSFNGTQYDFNGTYTLVLGIVGGIAAALLWKGKTKDLPLGPKQVAVVALGAFGLGTLLTFVDVLSHGKGVDLGGAHAGKAFGVYFTLVAAGAGAYMAWVLWSKTPASPPTSAPPPPANPPPAP